MIAVSIIEDDPSVRKILAGWISDAPDFQCAGVHATAAHAVEGGAAVCRGDNIRGLAFWQFEMAAPNCRLCLSIIKARRRRESASKR
ncbi:MAG TPA: hypothetical protein VGR14_18540 [Verrucomicrobiae bacterium]|jgi:hypothetical protein|nr:hypothetical protein [Verrucomicrobiae bacterium]